MADFGHLLIIEDTLSLSRTYEAYLKGAFAKITLAETAGQARDIVAEAAPDCILLDMRLPDADGLELLDQWAHAELRTPVVVITAHGSMSLAVDAMRRGAADFVVKPTTRDRLNATVRKAISSYEFKTTIATSAPVENEDTFCGILGQSLSMRTVFRTIEAAAGSKASVFITGETGTGKELVARAVHQMSPRARSGFIALNCGAIPHNLIESELFGHVKGAFTGATTDRVGAAELAEGGTLFLDELGEMPIDLQPKLLRFLQLGEYTRVGETRLRKANIRIVAATNRDPLEAVRAGRLREDLYYRLFVVPVDLPALRQRGADILLLAESFLQRFAREEGKEFSGFRRDAEEWLVSHAWPGNVRELENLIRQIVVMNPGGEIGRDALPHTFERLATQPTPVGEAAFDAPDKSREAGPSMDYGIEPLWLTEKKAIERAIALARGNVVAAAKKLQINPSTIYRKKAAWDRTATG